MGRPKSTVPTDAEFEILQCLWQRQIATVRDVQDDLVKNRKLAYTSIATIMRILVEKKFVEIVDLRRPQRFSALIDEIGARKQITDEWLRRQFNGSIADLVRHALTGRQMTVAQVRELKQIIDQSGSLPRAARGIA